MRDQAANGVDGERGTFGTAPTDGGDGTDGQAATAIADALGESNSATAVGGQGGRGGTGGGATRFSGADGADGGNGGNGADATATAHTSGAAEARAAAFGGRGGTVGSGGFGSPPGTNGLRGAQGGRGGNATAAATGENEFSSDSPEPNLDVTATASAQLGSLGQVAAGTGGDAAAEATGTATGEGSASARHVVQATANAGGGQFLADDGDAQATATGSTSFGRLNVEAEAIARDFSSFGSDGPGLGGDANAHASGMHSGAGTLIVDALAEVGTSGSDTGTGSASAEGIATAGADVEVTATLRSAGSIELRDAVSGSTSGRLSLTQQVWANTSSSSGNLLSGNVVTSLNATNAGGGDLDVEVRAFGGRPQVEGEIGGSATIESVTATGARDVIVDVDVGAGQNAAAFVGPVFGESTGGGDVEVEVSMRTETAGPLRVENLANGATTGTLTLNQHVESGALSFDANGNREALESVAQHTASSEQLTLWNSVSGWNAVAETDAENEAGSIEVFTRAAGTRAFESGSKGGDAAMNSRGRSQGDGNDVTVGRGIFSGRQDAIGGDGARAFGSADGGEGGRADGQAEAIAEGDSVVRLTNFTQGGDGGGFQRDSGDGVGGRGGDATTNGFARNAGPSAVSLELSATGGEGGRGYGEGRRSGEGGAATASARGESTGGADVSIRATARGGQGGDAGVTNELAGKGGDATVHNLGGATSGTLSITASAATGWPGGETDGRFRRQGESGVARLDIDVENEGGGALELVGSVSANYGGTVIVDSMRGTSSTGADVLVDLSVGASGGSFGAEPIGDADPIRIENLVEGETTGVLQLRQSVSAGTESGPITNSLRRNGDHQGLSVESDLYSSSAGAAESIASATNGSGWATAHAGSTAEGHRSISTADARGTGEGEIRATSESEFVRPRLDTAPVEASSQSTALSEGGGRTIAYADATNTYEGSVSAIADARNAGAGEVTSTARVEVDSSIATEDITVLATGHSTGGGDVLVTADVTRARSDENTNTILRDAVSGSTSGRLTLAHEILSRSGDIETELVAENLGGGDLALVIDADSQRVFEGFNSGPSEGGDIVLGDVIGRSENGRDVEINITATGNHLRRESLDDSSQPSRILGVSNGGAVTVSTSLSVGTDYTFTPQGGQSFGADGNSIDLENIVEGETSGALTLHQAASAGNAVGVEFRDNEVIEFIGGVGGSARSALTRDGDFSSLDLSVKAIGGRGGYIRTFGAPGTGGDGGDALAEVDATNQGGEVRANGTALGGYGGGGPASNGNGGAAGVDLRGQSAGDGNSVIVGSPTATVDDQPVGAVGGNGAGPSYFSDGPMPNGRSGDGGQATSDSVGIATGNSAVDVYARATGGRGGDGSRYEPSTSDGGHGGNALADAQAAGAGSERVRAFAFARGGDAGSNIGASNAGGANATSRASGLGLVEASSHASGGTINRSGASSANTVARAEAIGATAIAESTASTGRGGPVRASIGVRREATGFSNTAALAIGRHDAEIPDLSAGDPQGFARITSAPTQQGIENARVRHAALDALLSEPRPTPRVEALAHWSAAGDPDDPAGSAESALQLVRLDITFEPDPINREVLLAVFEESSAQGGFETLRFWLERNGEAFGTEQTFQTLEEANTFFADLIGLGNAIKLPNRFDDPNDDSSPATVSAFFEALTRPGQTVAFGIAALVVPEPGTAVLIGLGLMAMAGRGARRR